MPRSSSPMVRSRIDWSLLRKREDIERGPTYEARVGRALDAVAPTPVLIAEIILAMNHAQLSGQVNWSSPMDARINQVLKSLRDNDALERAETTPLRT